MSQFQEADDEIKQKSDFNNNNKQQKIIKKQIYKEYDFNKISEKKSIFFLLKQFKKFTPSRFIKRILKPFFNQKKQSSDKKVSQNDLDMFIINQEYGQEFLNQWNHFLSSPDLCKKLQSNKKFNKYQQTVPRLLSLNQQYQVELGQNKQYLVELGQNKEINQILLKQGKPSEQSIKSQVPPSPHLNNFNNFNELPIMEEHSDISQFLELTNDKNRQKTISSIKQLFTVHEKFHKQFADFMKELE